MDFARLAVTITRLVDDAFPGWVECLLLDAAGNQHWFTEKVPVVSDGCAGPDGVESQTGQSRFMVRAQQVERP